MDKQFLLWASACLTSCFILGYTVKYFYPTKCCSCNRNGGEKVDNSKEAVEDYNFEDVTKINYETADFDKANLQSGETVFVGPSKNKFKRFKRKRTTDNSYE